MGDKTIPYSSIAAVQFKKAGAIAGYIHLSLVGGIDSSTNVLMMANDENTVTFQIWGGKNKKFEEGKNIIEQKMMAAKSGGAHHKSEADDLEKFAQLRDKGVITEDEFQQKKKQLLGL